MVNLIKQRSPFSSPAWTTSMVNLSKPYIGMVERVECPKLDATDEVGCCINPGNTAFVLNLPYSI
jgi:hypothetical protein